MSIHLKQHNLLVVIALQLFDVNKVKNERSLDFCSKL